MAIIKKIKLPNGETYDIQDAGAARAEDLGEQIKVVNLEDSYIRPWEYEPGIYLFKTTKNAFQIMAKTGITSENTEVATNFITQATELLAKIYLFESPAQKKFTFSIIGSSHYVAKFNFTLTNWLTTSSDTWQYGVTSFPSATLEDGKIMMSSGGNWKYTDLPKELPAVTSDDDGKVLGVSNGAWSTVGSYATETYVDTKVADLVNSAPETLDTLGEVAAALQENEEVVDALNQAIGNKADSNHKHSWNELEDKPFGETISEIVEVFNQELYLQNPSYDDRNDYYNYVGEFPWLAEGQEYIVEFGGSQYSAVCYTQESGKYCAGELCLGDIDYVNYPFFIGGGSFRVGSTRAGYYPVIVYQSISGVSKLDEKYIPDTIARTSELISIEDVNKKIAEHDISNVTHRDIRWAISDLEKLVGNTSVSEQIEDAINEIPQADWNQSDESAPDYVKNRTHYEEESLVVLVPKTEIALVDGQAINPFSLELVDGQTYFVEYYDEKYELVAYTIEGPGGEKAILIGNMNEGVPFMIGVMDNGQVILMGNQTGHSVSISISIMEKEIHYLDPKYIKDMYYDNTKKIELNETCNVSAFVYTKNETLQHMLIYADDLSNITVTLVGNTEYLNNKFGGTYTLCNKVGNPIETVYSLMDSNGIINDFLEVRCYAGVGVEVFSSSDAADGTILGTATFTGYYMNGEIHYLDSKYIKDMYYEKPKAKLIFENTFKDITETEYMYWPDSNGSLERQDSWEITLPEKGYIVNDEYTIVLNGVSYKLTLNTKWDMYNGALYLGFGFVEDGEPLGGPATDGSAPFVGYFYDWISQEDQRSLSGMERFGELRIYIPKTSEVFPETVIQIYHNETEIKQLEPTFVKNMYYDNTKVLAECIVESPNELYLLPELPNDFRINNSYVFEVNGIEYKELPSNGTSGDIGFYFYFGSEYSEDSWKDKFYPFSVLHRGTKIDNYIIFNDTATFPATFKLKEKNIKYVHPKYINDMYYDATQVLLSKTFFNDGSGIFEYHYDEFAKEYHNIVENYNTVTLEANGQKFTLYSQGFRDGYYNLYSDPSNTNQLGDGVILYNYIGGTKGHIVHFYPEQLGLDNTVESYNVKILFEDIHYLDPKYIKDMYHEEIKEIFNVKDAEFTDGQYQYQPGFVIIKGNTYIVNWDGIEYVCESYAINDEITCIGNMAAEGGPNTGEPFLIGYLGFENVNAFIADEPGSSTHTISIREKVIHTIHPKYIKDMYYDNGKAVTELVPLQTISGFMLAEDPIHIAPNPFELKLIEGATYIVNWDGTEYELTCEVFQGFPYIGNFNLLNMQSGGDVPFIIAVNEAEAMVVVATESTAESHEIGIVEIKHDIKQLDIKYLPILEEEFKTVFEMEGTTGGEQIFDESYRKLVGKYRVTVDSKTENAEFIEENNYGHYFSDNFNITTWDGGIYFQFSEDGEHFIKIEEISKVVKEEHLPKTIATADNLEDLLPDSVVKTSKQDLSSNQILNALTNLSILEKERWYLDHFTFVFNNEGICETDVFEKYINSDSNVYYCISYRDENYQNFEYIGARTNAASSGEHLAYIDFGRFKAYPNYIVDTEANYDEKSIRFSFSYCDKIINPMYLQSSDWNENFEEASTYIKNRTHYEVTEQATVLYNETLTFEPVEVNGITVGQCNNIQFDEPIENFKVGDRYVITILREGGDGYKNKYECVAFNANDYMTTYALAPTIAFGDPYYLTLDESIRTNEAPFLFIPFSEIALGESGEYLIRIDRIDTLEVKQLDEKYIPDTIARVSDLVKPQPYFVLTDTATGALYKIEITNGNLVSSPLEET